MKRKRLEWMIMNIQCCYLFLSTGAHSQIVTFWTLILKCSSGCLTNYGLTFLCGFLSLCGLFHFQDWRQKHSPETWRSLKWGSASAPLQGTGCGFSRSYSLWTSTPVHMLHFHINNVSVSSTNVFRCWFVVDLPARLSNGWQWCVIQALKRGSYIYCTYYLSGLCMVFYF